MRAEDGGELICLCASSPPGPVLRGAPEEDPPSYLASGMELWLKARIRHSCSSYLSALSVSCPDRGW